MNSNLHLARMIIGSSFATCKMRDLISSVADFNVAVMAQGPTGAGKELVARGIHLMSGRKGKLVAVNCAAIPSDLLEAELFGYEKGAFTGAEKRRAGRFEEAKGGTLFLDEIGDMPLELHSGQTFYIASMSSPSAFPPWLNDGKTFPNCSGFWSYVWRAKIRGCNRHLLTHRG